MGSMTLAEALASDDGNVGKLKVVSLLESLPGVGKVKAARSWKTSRSPTTAGCRASVRSRRLQTARSTRLTLRDHRRLRTWWGRQGHHRRTSRRARSRSCGSAARGRPANSAPCEAADAYVFTDTASFERPRQRGRLPGVDRVPRPLLRQSDPGGADALDVVLEIEVDGAQQVKRLYPEALLIFVLPPSRDEQERRLRGRGDPNDKVFARLKKAEVEEPIGRELAD